MCPLVASIPIRPSPGWHSVPSSAMTTLLASISNRGAPSAPVPTSRPCPPVSDAPNPSCTNVVGSTRASASFTAGERMAPPEP
jgi:hypothetical protein